MHPLAKIIRILIDGVSLFLPLPKPSPVHKTGKKILIMNWRDTRHTYVGGAEIYLHELAKRWVQQGSSVTWFCGNDGHSPRYETIDGIQIIRRGGFYFVYIWAFLYYILRFRGKYDIVVDCQNGIPFFTPLFVKEKIFCVVFHIHQEVFYYSLIWPLSAFASFLENTVMHWAYKDISFITISQSTKTELENLGFGKKSMTVIHPGVDIDTYIPGTKTKHPTVLYVGRLKSYKSINTMIDAAQRIVERMPSARIIIAGDGEEKNRLTEKMRRLGLNRYVTFLGRVSEKEKIELYQQAWVFVHPSLKEGWGMTNIEANACATPVVAANVSGLQDSVIDKKTGYLVPHSNAKLFAETVVSLLQDTKKREAMSKEAVIWAHNFSWDKSAQESLRLFKEKSLTASIQRK